MPVKSARKLSVRSSLVTVSLLLLALVVPVAAGSQPIGSFAETGLAGWTGKKFQGETEYVLVEDGGRQVLQATSRGAASGLVFETDYQPHDYPLLRWSWKISNTLNRGDSRSKAGDDYAARIYVVFPHWFFPKTKTLNYIWANRLSKGAMQANAYTSNAVMIAVESGGEHLNEWRTEQRNILDDYRRAFGEDPPAVGAIAVMTDTDNTGESATAWYGDILAIRQ